MQYFLGNSDSHLTCWHSQIPSVTEIFTGSDWLRLIKWHNTVSSLAICNLTQPSDWLPPDWPQIVTNCTEQVSPQPSTRTDTTHWSLVLTAFGVMTMLSLFYTLIQSHTNFRSYMVRDWSTSLGLRATWKIKSKEISHDSTQSSPKYMICHFSDIVCHRRLKSLHPYRSPALLNHFMVWYWLYNSSWYFITSLPNCQL